MSTKNKRLLLIFLKEPVPGKVKTRLAHTLGKENAVNIYQSLVSVLLEQLKWIPNCHYRFCYAPSDAEDAMLQWILPQLDHKVTFTPAGPALSPLSADGPSIDFQAQSDGDLGDRLSAAFKTGFQEGFSEIAAIGTDCPYLSARWIDTAFLSGRHADVVIGPSYDGGYYYIALKEDTNAPFTNIPWSAEDTFSVTQERLKEAGLSTYLLPQLSDIDHEEDWNAALDSPLGARLKKHVEKLSNLT